MHTAVIFIVALASVIYTLQVHKLGSLCVCVCVCVVKGLLYAGPYSWMNCAKCWHFSNKITSTKKGLGFMNQLFLIGVM